MGEATERREILNRINVLGVTVPRPNYWKIQQLRLFHDAIKPLAWRLQKAEAELLALRVLNAAATESTKDGKRWPQADTPLKDQAEIATRLLELSKATGRPMVELLEECRRTANENRLGPFYALRVTETCSGWEWYAPEGKYYAILGRTTVTAPQVNE